MEVTFPNIDSCGHNREVADPKDMRIFNLYVGKAGSFRDPKPVFTVKGMTQGIWSDVIEWSTSMEEAVEKGKKIAGDRHFDPTPKDGIGRVVKFL